MVLPVLQLKTPQSLIIKVDSINPVLVDVGGDVVVYNVIFSFNPKLAVQLNASTLYINATTKLGNTTNVPLVIRGTNTKDITANLLQQSNIYNRASQRGTDYVVSVSTDIRSYISKSPSFLSVSQLFKKVFVMENAGALSSLNKTTNVLDQNVAGNVSSTYSQSPYNLRQQINKLRITQKIDPASLYIGGTNAIIPASKTFSGVAAATNYTQNQLINSSLAAKNIIASQLSKTVINTQNDINQNRFITTVQKVATDNLTVSKTIVIPINKLGKSDFKFIIELYDINERKLQTIDKFVPHNANVSALIPIIPPKISPRANFGIGNIAIDVQQLDSYAKGIAVYRKILRTQQQNMSSEFEKVADFKLMAGNLPYTFRDKVTTSNDIIYRFIPYGENKTLASVFASIIQKTNNNLINKKTERRAFCVMDYSMDSEALIIKANSFPVEAVAVRFYRRNKTTNQVKFLPISSYLRRNAGGNIPLRIIDREVQKYQIYEYKIGILYADGIEQLAPQVLILEYRPIDQNIATAVITNIQNQGYGDGNKDVTFNVGYSINDNQYNDIKKLLSQQNYLAEYQDQVKENRDFLKTLLAYKVMRLNLTTGELEDFGVITSLNFSDRKYGAARGVKPVVEGTEYKYKIITYIRDPDTLYPSIARTINPGTKKISQKYKNLTKTYTLYPYEWLQPIILRNGTTYTDASVINSYPGTLASFEFGNIVDIQEFSISILGDLPTIQNSSVFQIQNRGCFIQWEVNGNIKKIDHFIISLDILGMKTIVGVAHNINNTGKFEYLHPLANGERGEITYYITPVYYDDTQGSAIKTNTIII